MPPENTSLTPDDPHQIGPYRPLRKLGAGGMGQVYLARSRGGRNVALKVIRPDLAQDPDFRARFAREVAAARAVSGVFTASVVDADPDAATPWLATEYVPGPSLNTAVREHGPLPVPSVHALAAGLAEALAAIHRSGVIHRDLKPSNVLLALDGPRVIDFGISRAAESTDLTRTGTLIGSPGFMSPEQIQGGVAVTPATDVFSLGAVLAFAASGAGPFGEGATPALLYRVVHAEPQLDAVPPQLRNLIAHCLAKDPAARPTPDALLDQLEASDYGPSPTQPGWLPLSVTGMITQVAADVPPTVGTPTAPVPPPRPTVAEPLPRPTLAEPATPTTPAQLQTRGQGRRLAALTLLSVVLLALLGYGLWALFHNTGGHPSAAPPTTPSTSATTTTAPPSLITTPDVTGDSEPAARQALTAAGFADANIRTTRNCSGAPSGRSGVLDQSPAPGDRVDHSATVHLTLESPNCLAYPDERGRPLSQARADLTARGFTDITARPAPSCTNGDAPDTVESQSPDPTPGKALLPTARITLTTQPATCSSPSPTPTPTPTPSPTPTSPYPTPTPTPTPTST